MTLIKKEFKGNNWIECLSYVKRFIDDFNLELISIDLHKKEDYYVAKVEYELGVRK